MLISEIQYIKYVENTGCEIGIINNNKQTINLVLQEAMERYCYGKGFAFKGVLEASKYHLGRVRKPPILIMLDRPYLFFSTHSFNNPKCVWISFDQIMTIKAVSSKQTAIRFVDGFELVVNTGIRSIKREINLCIQYQKKIREFQDIEERLRNKSYEN